MQQSIVDYFNIVVNATFPAAGQTILIVPLELPHYAYINMLSGSNAATNSYNAIVGYIDDGGNYVPMSLTACAQNAAFNTVIQKLIRPELGAYLAVTASTYPVTATFMVDGWLFDLE